MKTFLNEKLGLALLAQAAIVGQGMAQQDTWQPDRTILPVRLPARQTYTELDARKAIAPSPVPDITAPAGAPNIVIILIDDMGFGATETFGGPIPMPTLDRLANNGLIYTTIASAESLDPGTYELTYDFVYDGGGFGKGGTGTISINGKIVAEKRLDKTQPSVFSGTGNDLADVGTDNGTLVADYGSSPKFNGKINDLTIECMRRTN